VAIANLGSGCAIETSNLEGDKYWHIRGELCWLHKSSDKKMKWCTNLWKYAKSWIFAKKCFYRPCSNGRNFAFNINTQVYAKAQWNGYNITASQICDAREQDQNRMPKKHIHHVYLQHRIGIMWQQCRVLTLVQCRARCGQRCWSWVSCFSYTLLCNLNIPDLWEHLYVPTGASIPWYEVIGKQ
jgi:hypothetical protein